MAYFKPVLIFLSLFGLTSILCLISTDLFLLNPILSIGFFLTGVLGVVMTVDMITAVIK